MPRACTLLISFSRTFLQSVEKKFPGDRERLGRMSLIEEGFPKQIRMAYLAIIGMFYLSLTLCRRLTELHTQALARSTVSPNFTRSS